MMSIFPEDDSPIKEDLEPLIQTLENDPDWNKRFGSASKLFRLGREKAVDPLIKALQNDKHKEIRRFAANLLGRLGDPRATWALIATLRQALIEKDATITHQASKSLLLIGGSDLPSILASTIDDHEEFFEMRAKAIELLGKIGDSKSVEYLIKAINNPDTDGKLRGRAIKELVNTGHLAGLQLILDLLEISSNKAFQKIVVSSLRKTPFKNRTIIFRIGDSLLKILEHEESKRKDKDEELSKLVANALKQFSDNINLEFKAFLDEIIVIRKKQKGK